MVAAPVNPTYTITGNYNTVAASQTDQVLSRISGGSTGQTGDFLESVIINAGSTTPGVVTIKDGTTAIITTTVGTATVMPYIVSIPIRAYSKTGSWKISTGAAVQVVAVGYFS